MPSISYSQRASFERACLAEIAALLKGSPWKRKHSTAFTTLDEHFHVGSLSTYRNASRSVARFEFKPLGIDEVLWEILGLPENAKQPLSFRAWGAFTCSSLPFCEGDLEREGDSASDVATRFVTFLHSTTEDARIDLQNRGFMRLLREHPNHVERGAYAITEVAALIHQAQYAEAATIATEYESGRRRSVGQIMSDGASFHAHALRWLSARKSLH